jgi:hypothetical protein
MQIKYNAKRNPHQLRSKTVQVHSSRCQWLLSVTLLGTPPATEAGRLREWGL